MGKSKEEWDFLLISFFHLFISISSLHLPNIFLCVFSGCKKESRGAGLFDMQALSNSICKHLQALCFAVFCISTRLQAVASCLVCCKSFALFWHASSQHFFAVSNQHFFASTCMSCLTGILYIYILYRQVHDLHAFSDCKESMLLIYIYMLHG